MTEFTSREAPGTVGIFASFLPKIGEDRKMVLPTRARGPKTWVPWRYAIVPCGKSGPGCK